MNTTPQLKFSNIGTVNDSNENCILQETHVGEVITRGMLSSKSMSGSGGGGNKGHHCGGGHKGHHGGGGKGNNGMGGGKGGGFGGYQMPKGKGSGGFLQHSHSLPVSSHVVKGGGKHANGNGNVANANLAHARTTSNVRPGNVY